MRIYAIIALAGAVTAYVPPPQRETRRTNVVVEAQSLPKARSRHGVVVAGMIGAGSRVQGRGAGGGGSLLSGFLGVLRCVGARI